MIEYAQSALAMLTGPSWLRSLVIPVADTAIGCATDVVDGALLSPLGTVSEAGGNVFAPPATASTPSTGRPVSAAMLKAQIEMGPSAAKT